LDSHGLRADPVHSADSATAEGEYSPCDDAFVIWGTPELASDRVEPLIRPESSERAYADRIVGVEPIERKASLVESTALPDWEVRKFWRKYIGYVPREERDPNYVREDLTRPPRVYDIQENPDCPVCAIAEDRLHFTPSGLYNRGEARDLIGIPSISWQDCVICPVGAGWNYRDQCFMWFGRVLNAPMDKPRPMAVRRQQSITVLDVVSDLQTVLRNAGLLDSAPIQSSQLPTGLAYLPRGGNASPIRVAVYPVSEDVAVAVVVPLRQRGNRINIRGFYDPRHDRIGVGNKHVVVKRMVGEKFLPCGEHLLGYVEKPQGGLTGLVLRTGVPVPMVSLTSYLYEQLWKSVCMRTRNGSSTLVLLEGTQIR